MGEFKIYCEFVKDLELDNLHRLYHDKYYGFPINDDNELFARLIFEINQAGLSWTTILKKENNFRKAFDNFDIKKVAKYNERDKQRLLNDAGIIRNRSKIEATIHNANVILGMQKEFGSFKNWLDVNHPKTKEEWVGLFKKTFRFTGGEIVNEFMVSAGYLRGGHQESCPVYQEIINSSPAWLVRPNK